MRQVVSAGALPTVCPRGHLSADDSVSVCLLLQTSVLCSGAPMLRTGTLLCLHFDLLHSADSRMCLPA